MQFRCLAEKLSGFSRAILTLVTLGGVSVAEDDAKWGDSDREDLRATLREVVVGETRFGRRDPEQIIQLCEEVYLEVEEDLPKGERSDFMSFTKDEIARFESEYLKEQLDWPERTDCDRLDEAQRQLLRDGIVLWQASPCCDSCTSGDFPTHLDELEKMHPGLRARLRGYAFFIDQTMAEMLAEGTQISVYLGYGSLADGDNPERPGYEARALEIGREVLKRLRANGLATDWDGSFGKKIGIDLDWKRRTPLP